MAYTEIASGTWGTGPKIPYTFYYSKSRSGKDMTYKIKVVIGAISGSSYFGYPIKVSVNCGGKTASSQIKNASPSQWSTAISYETDNLTVTNKTSGTTSLSITLTGVEAPRGSTTYTYNLPIDPAMSSVSAKNANIGSTSEITISKSNKDFTHTLQYSYDGRNFTTIVTKTPDSSYNWTIPEATYDYVGASSKSKTITIKCITYSGSTEIGSTTTTLSAKTVEAACKPEVTLTIEHNTARPLLTGSENIIINNNGEIVITGTSTAKNGATIANNTITVGSEVYNSNTQTLNKLSSGTITFTATDSRGYSSSVTENRTVVNYVKPTIIIEMPTISTDGVATFDVKGNWFNSTFGVVPNTIAVQYSYCEVDAEFEEWHDAEATINIKLYSAHITASGLDYTKRYKFKARVLDKINTVESEEVAAQAIPVFDWGAEDFNFNVPVKAPSLTLDNPWQSVTFTANSTNVSSASATVRYSPLLGICVIRVYATSNRSYNSGYQYTIGSIAEHLPTVYQSLACYNTAGNVDARITTDGDVQVFAHSTCSSGYDYIITGIFFAARGD